MKTTDQATVEERVVRVLASRFGEVVHSLEADTEFISALPGFDSLAALEVVTAMEAEFGFEVDFVADDVRYSFSTLARLNEYVGDRLEDGA